MVNGVCGPKYSLLLSWGLWEGGVMTLHPPVEEPLPNGLGVRALVPPGLQGAEGLSSVTQSHHDMLPLYRPKTKRAKEPCLKPPRPRAKRNRPSFACQSSSKAAGTYELLHRPNARHSFSVWF